MTPDSDNALGGLIAAAYRAEAERNPLPVVGNAWFRHSDAGGCARQLAYKMSGTEPTEVTSDTSYHSFRIGHAVHDVHQAAILEYLDETALIELETTIPDTVPGQRCASAGGRCVAHDADLEENGDCPKAEVERPLTGAHIDAVTWDAEGRKAAVEIKSVNPYTYEEAVLKGWGPKFGHILQASLNARAIDADLAVVVYVPLTALSKGRADKKGIADTNRHGAQWTFDRARYEPIADHELARVDWIRRTTLERGPQAVIRWWAADKEQGPDDDPITIRDPSTTTFPCGADGGGYCAWLSKCISDGA